MAGNPDTLEASRERIHRYRDSSRLGKIALFIKGQSPEQWDDYSELRERGTSWERVSGGVEILIRNTRELRRLAGPFFTDDGTTALKKPRSRDATALTHVGTDVLQGIALLAQAQGQEPVDGASGSMRRYVSFGIAARIPREGRRIPGITRLIELTTPTPATQLNIYIFEADISGPAQRNPYTLLQTLEFGEESLNYLPEESIECLLEVMSQIDNEVTKRIIYHEDRKPDM